MRVRSLPLTRKSLFPAISLAAAIGLVAVPASAATAPPPTTADTHVAVTAPRPVDQNAAYFVSVAQGAAALARGKVSTADLDVQIALVEQSPSMSVDDAQTLTDQLRTMTAALGTQVVAYDQAQARKAAAEKAAKEKAAKAAAARAAAAAAQARQTGYQKSAPAPASVGGGGGLSPDAARAYAQSLLGGYGWGGDQFQCLNSLWNRESGWNYRAANPSGAYGIPQALPGSKMGPGWQNDARVQIQWGLGYIRGSYGTPCGAWGHSQSTGWY